MGGKASVGQQNTVVRDGVRKLVTHPRKIDGFLVAGEPFEIPGFPLQLFLLDFGEIRFPFFPLAGSIVPEFFQ